MPVLGNTTPFYGGGQVPNPANVLVNTTAPTTSNFANDDLGTIWLNKTTSAFYALGSVASGVATWVPLGGGSTDVNTLTPDTGTSPVVPVGGTITLAGGTGIQTVGGTNVMTFNVTGGGVEFTVVTANTSMAVNTGYITNKAGTAASMTLPTTAAVGTLIRVVGLNATGWSVAQNANQMIHMNSVTTTTGVGGSLASTAQYNAVALLCTVANLEWTVISSEGVLTVT